MKKIFGVIISFIVFGVVVFLLRIPLTQQIFSLQDEYFPCSRSITYSIGTFDDRFGISKEEFLNNIDLAKNTWEKSINKTLFTYVPDGSGELKINLIYDNRQQASQKLKGIGIIVNESKTSYDDLKSRFNTMKTDYTNLKAQFESRVALFKIKQDAYQKEVTFFNTNDGASQSDYNRLNKEKKSLELEFAEINKLQNEINSEVENVNALVVVLNDLASSLNLEVNKFNTIGEELGEEFEEGIYQEGQNGRQIDIYQFDSLGKLARVLTHEFGHALGLEHSEDTKAVMYRLNNGINEKLTADDILALKKHCGLIPMIK